MDQKSSPFSSLFSESFWFPPNTTWNNVKTNSNIRYAKPWHLLLFIAFGIALIFIRQFVERYILAPFGRSLGIKDVRTKPPGHNEVLERNYKKNRRLHVGKVTSLSKQTDLTEREIEHWWMLRRAQDKPTILNKFCETSFKGLCYTWNFYFGLYTIWDKDYLWDIDLCFKDYPHHSLENGPWSLYMSVIGFYWSLLFAHFYEARRLDFYQMLLHHTLSICLGSLSFVSNMHRFFHVIIVLHDIVEYLLHIIKAVKYAKYERLAQVLFLTFAALWTTTRVLIYPVILYRYLFKAPLYFSAFPVYNIIAIILIILQFLHIFWTYLIYKITLRTIKENFEDIRSDAEDE